MKISNKILSKTTLSLAALVAVAFTSCKTDPLSPGVEYMPDMYRSPSVETYSVNPVYDDGMASRKPVAGTVGRGYSITGENVSAYVNSAPYMYPNTPEGYEAAGVEVKSPLTITAETIEQGRNLYGKFCVVCHGEQGKGDGSIVANGKFPGPPPSYSGPLKDLSEGKMFHTITYGKGLMGSHASQLSKEERWKVISYVQTLQKLGQPAAAALDTTAKATDNKENQPKKDK